MNDDYEVENTRILNETGFWGKEGTGAILYSPQKNKFGLGLRSQDVEEPGTIGTFGGAIDGESGIEESLNKELEEEIGMLTEPKLKKLFVYENKSFKYHNFLAIIDDSLFYPTLNWENDEILWMSLSEMINVENKHFGLEALLNDRESVQILNNIEGQVARISNEHGM